MATLSVFVCPGASQVLLTDPSGAQFPGCSGGQGSYQQVTIAEPFDPSQIDGEQLSEAMGAGFVVMGTGLVIVLAAKFLLRALHLGTRA